MKFVITRDMDKLDFVGTEFWDQFDEVEVENPNGWYMQYVLGGFVHTFGYCQSSGHGEYFDEYREDIIKAPLNFSDDLKANAEILQNTYYNGKKAMLIREP